MKMTGKKWWSVRWLVAAGGVLLFASCRAPAPEAGRYQMAMTSIGGGGGESYTPVTTTVYVMEMETGRILQRDINNAQGWKFVPSSVPVSPSVFDDAQASYERAEEAKKKAQAELQVKREVFCKTLAQKSLEEQVAWADDIYLYDPKRRGDNPPFRMLLRSFLKSSSPRTFPSSSYNVLPANLTFEAEDVLVGFRGNLDDNAWVQFFLSSAAFDNKTVFLAPATIEDDVKAEVKRQEPKQEQMRKEEAEKKQQEMLQRAAEAVATQRVMREEAAAQEAAEEKEGR
ncbi:MAG: hypothetical protein FWH21_01285 [Kiritimatiellaeota bacterium]|nr:hypothetical protein [Kiritimatiellota bacterium]